MEIKEANIFLDKESYYAGQAINGRIEYVFDSPMKVRGITVTFKGEGYTEFPECIMKPNFGDGIASRTVCYNGHEEYFQLSYYLLGSFTGKERVIPAGKHVYTFSCTLPTTLPSSFFGEHGYVKYDVKVTLDRPWSFDQETTTHFTVTSQLNLNINRIYKVPIHMQLAKSFYCFCDATSFLDIDVRSPYSGYVPGQMIPVQVNVENFSKVEVRLIKISLREIVTYKTSRPSRNIKRIKHDVECVQEGPVPRNTVKSWILYLSVPDIPPSNILQMSNIMSLYYDLKVDCEIPGSHFNMKKKECVYIGTVPLDETVIKDTEVEVDPTLTICSQVDPNHIPEAMSLTQGDASEPVVHPEPAGHGDTLTGEWMLPNAPPEIKIPFKLAHSTIDTVAVMSVMPTEENCKITKDELIESLVKELSPKSVSIYTFRDSSESQSFKENVQELIVTAKDMKLSPLLRQYQQAKQEIAALLKYIHTLESKVQDSNTLPEKPKLDPNPPFKNCTKKQKIIMAGSQQCMGLPSALQTSRYNTPYESYQIVGYVIPFATTVQILKVCTDLKLDPQDKLILCVGENDHEPPIAITELYSALKKFENNTVLILNVNHSVNLNTVLLNRQLYLICKKFPNCYFVVNQNCTRNYLYDTCCSVNLIIDFLDYKHSYLGVDVLRHIHGAHSGYSPPSENVSETHNAKQKSIVDYFRPTLKNHVNCDVRKLYVR